MIHSYVYFFLASLLLVFFLKKAILQSHCEITYDSLFHKKDNPVFIYLRNEKKRRLKISVYGKSLQNSKRKYV